MSSAVPVPMSLLMSKVPALAPSAALLLADSGRPAGDTEAAEVRASTLWCTVSRVVSAFRPCPCWSFVS